MKTAKPFDHYYQPEPNSGCWLWTGSSDSGGYGQLRRNRVLTPAHRFSYEQVHGPIPIGLEIDHLCRVRCCVNPKHLEAVTKRENILRGEGIPAMNAKKTHCPYGHEYSSQNTYVHYAEYGDARQCVQCRGVRNERKRMKKVITILAAATLFASGCAATTVSVGSLVLPTSNRKIDVVQHRSDSKECVVGFVLQTYDAKGELIDSKSGSGNALACQVIGAGIQAGGIMGGAALLRPSRTSNNNNNEQGQGQIQLQGQHQSQKQGDKEHHGRGGHGGYDLE